MGIIPNTGQEVKMGRVRNAYGLTGTVRLTTDLGPYKPGGNTVLETLLSTSFGGQTTPNTY